uniref:Uncharacterized protein n=1 Tax=Anguilla anguilla TaxID=7936 RepID=A0A0E9X1L6_ANGAN
MIPKSEKWQVYLKQVRNGTYTLASTKDCSWSPNNYRLNAENKLWLSVICYTEHVCGSCTTSRL